MGLNAAHQRQPHGPGLQPHGGAPGPQERLGERRAVLADSARLDSDGETWNLLEPDVT